VLEDVVQLFQAHTVHVGRQPALDELGT